MKDLKNILKNKYLPENNLSSDIWVSILKEKSRIRMIELKIYSSIGVIASLFMIPIVKELIVNFSQSGFYEYLSVALSDGRLAVLYWREIGLSLLESLPVLSIVLTLTVLYILIVSIRFIIRNLRSPLLIN